MSEASDQDRMARVARRAYERYVARGQSAGHDLEDWLVAEREIASEEQGTDVLNERLNERVSELSAGNGDSSERPGANSETSPRPSRPSPRQPRAKRDRDASAGA